MTDQASIEAMARIIDPSSWRVMDGYLAQAKQEYKGQDGGWPEDQFKHKESMAKAREILAALQHAPPVDLEQAAIALKTSREAPGSIVAPENSLRARELATWALFYGDKLIANALSSRKGGKPDEFEASINAELVGLIRETAARILGGNRTFADDDLKAIEARLTTTALERDDLRHRLDEAADQFAFYADEHAKKGTAAGNAKACTNRTWSVACAKPALTKEPSHGE